MATLKIFLPSEQDKALRKLAEAEYRDPRAQAAFIVRQELARRGLLPQATAVTGGQHGQ
jgi:hypothetical protein